MALNAGCLLLKLNGEDVLALDIIKSNALFAADRNAKDFKTAREQVASYRNNAVATLVGCGVSAQLATALVKANWAQCVRHERLKRRVASAHVGRAEPCA